MWRSNDPRWLIPFGLFTAVVVGLILFRVFVVQPVVPKPRFWSADVTPIPVAVCPGIDRQRLEEVALDLPSCAFRFYDSDGCDCTSVGKRTIPYGYVEVVPGPVEENPLTNYLVAGKSTWTNEHGKEEPAGEILGACVVVPTVGRLPSEPVPELGIPGDPGLDLDLVYAHELGHACGYAHVVGDPTSTNAHRHLMSPDHSYQGTDRRGMDLAAEEQGNLEVSP